MSDDSKNSGPEEAIKGVVEDAKGKAKEVIGTVAGRNDLVNEGKNAGLMVESDSQLLTTVGTNVVYASAVDRKTQHFTKALVRGDVIYNKNFQNYLDAAAAKGWIPQEAEVSDEPDDGQVQG